MQAVIFPSSRLTRWLTAPRSDVGPAIASHLMSGLFGSIPMFLGGVINSIVVAAVAAARHPTRPFILWLAVEIMMGIGRLCVVAVGNRAQKLGRAPPVGIAVLLSCGWAACVGFGAYISIASADWLIAIVAFASAAAMVSGICLRNFGTPRLVTLMMALSLAPCAIAALLSKQLLLLLVAIQLPIYMVAISSAAFRLNAMLVDRMLAQHALEQSEAFNRSILESSPDYTLVLDERLRIAFCKASQAKSGDWNDILGTLWLDLLPLESRAEGIEALRIASAGEIARLTVRDADASGILWFDLAVSRVADGSGRILIIGRDITHQKNSEERALWMANHDPLTGLPNRVVLQSFLEKLSVHVKSPATRALLVLDLDNFKVINDTLGHDAGDAMLCAFADRLRSAVRPDDLVARLGGDEFAIVLHARSEEEVAIAAQKIFAQLRLPLAHSGRLLELNASIGASFYPRDGIEGSDLMKSADIALYCAKAGGRGQLKIFKTEMRKEFQKRNSMMTLARRAIAAGDVLPHYQPKVNLRTGEIVGFEALLRWRDSSGKLRLPEDVSAAFEDASLAAAISNTIIDRTLGEIRDWLDEGVEFGHVAINVAAAEFRSGRFAEDLLEKLERSKIPPRFLQIEVTETVFLGRGADHVQRALAQLHRAGVRIALDDFGTGYASLAHLMQFPVDGLKIDKSFIRGIGRSSGAEAITRAIINLGDSLGVEIIAEGIESAEQEVYLIGLGCQTGQGFLYSKAIPPEMVARMLAGSIAKLA